MVPDTKKAKINIAVKCFSTYSRNADLLKNQNAGDCAFGYHHKLSDQQKPYNGSCGRYTRQLNHVPFHSRQCSVSS